MRTPTIDAPDRSLPSLDGAISLLPRLLTQAERDAIHAARWRRAVAARTVLS